MSIVKDPKNLKEMPTDTEKRNKEIALKSALEQIDKSYGKGSIMKMGDKSTEKSMPVIPTGSIALDIALGVGGVPRGRIIEIYGQESSGKTTTYYSRSSKTWRNGSFNRRGKCL